MAEHHLIIERAKGADLSQLKSNIQKALGCEVAFNAINGGSIKVSFVLDEDYAVISALLEYHGIYKVLRLA
jgi:hypothetical protein